MVNIFMIIICLVIVVLVMLGSIYLIAYFQHPDDRNVAIFPKIIIVIGLSLATTSILMLPLDVANKGGEGGFPMETMWLAIYIIIAVFSIVIVPFAMFYYESEEADGSSNQFVSAIKGTIVILFVFCAITFTLWCFIGVAQIPTIVVSSNLNTTSPAVLENGPPTGSSDDDIKKQRIWWSLLLCTNNQSFNIAKVQPKLGTIPDYVSAWVNIYYPSNASIPRDANNLYNYPGYQSVEYRDTNQFIIFRVSLALFVITMVSFGGWILFIIFGGIGIAALPMDMIGDFRFRPQRIPYDIYLKRKDKIGERASELVEIGKNLQQRHPGGILSGRKQKRNYNRFRAAVFLLEEDYEHLKICYQRQGGKVIFYYAQLFLGFIAAFLSILWILQNILYMWTQPEPFFPFLNSMVIKLDTAWGFLGTITYGIFSLYLLFCVVKGNFKFGLRLFFLFPIHPMRVGGTMMNAFLFNVGMILICSISVTQFCTMAFSQYASATSINSMFSLAVRNIMIIKWFWVAYIIAFFCMGILSAILLAVFRKDGPKKIDFDEERKK